MSAQNMHSPDSDSDESLYTDALGWQSSPNSRRPSRQGSVRSERRVNNLHPDISNSPANPPPLLIPRTATFPLSSSPAPSPRVGTFPQSSPRPTPQSPRFGQSNRRPSILGSAEPPVVAIEEEPSSVSNSSQDRALPRLNIGLPAGLRTPAIIIHQTQSPIAPSTNSQPVPARPEVDGGSGALLTGSVRSSATMFDRSNHSSSSRSESFGQHQTVAAQGRSRAWSQSSNASAMGGSNLARTLSNASTNDLICADCKRPGPGRQNCNICRCLLCHRCWDAQAAHQEPSENLDDIPHYRVDHDLWITVQSCFKSNLKQEQRDALHEADSSTTWFGTEEDQQHIIFRDYGRFADIVSKVQHTTYMARSSVSYPNYALYPSLASFVGETGAGKSTLIKLLIELRHERDEDLAEVSIPVSGAASSTNCTSEGVHLYLAPGTGRSTLQLFADCEGLTGGVRIPEGERVKRKRRKLAEEARRAEGRIKRKKYASERVLHWVTARTNKHREIVVSQLYPRVLYTFSDVIVFVHRNAKTIEVVFEMLLDWGMNALEKSSNQPILPHAIIVFNAINDNLPEEEWAHERSTQKVLHSVRECLGNSVFKRFVDFWKESGRVFEDFQDLILAYYGSITIMYMPTGRNTNVLKSQVDSLQSLIQIKSDEARQKRQDARMLLDSDAFQAHLSSAFDHFALTLDEAFDFVKASFALNPVPSDFASNIVRLARQMAAKWPREPGRLIFDQLSELIASCIMLDAARNKIRGNLELVFREYSNHVDEALSVFCDSYWPCEYEHNGYRCVNVRTGHDTKGHQAASGKIIDSRGGYVSAFTYEQYQNEFLDKIFAKLEELRQRLRPVARSQRSHSGQVRRMDVSESQRAAELHKSDILQPFFLQASGHCPEDLSNHCVCLCCLFEAAEHALPCGHIICTPCLRSYGLPCLEAARGSRTFVIALCPMEQNRVFSDPPKFTLKSPDCGTRILTLDGGGIKGIAELEMLHALEDLLGQPLQIKHFFDLIVGTSAGGIIALGLTVRNWTVLECKRNYMELSQRSFIKRPLADLRLLSWAAEKMQGSKYRTFPVEDALREAFGSNTQLFGGVREHAVNADLKVAITATTTLGNPVVFANYNRHNTEGPSYQFYRPEDSAGELKVWQVARATSAAPMYFKHFYHAPSKQGYVDGGLYHNNPIQVADRERALIWPGSAGEHPDVVLSVGCCLGHTKPKATYKRSLLDGVDGRSVWLRVAKQRLKAAQNSEEIWESWLYTKNPTGRDEERYVRLNPKLDRTLPKMDSFGEMQDFQKDVQRAIATDGRLLPLAKRLVASCFYFQVEHNVSFRLDDSLDETFEIHGTIVCRFANRGFGEAAVEFNALVAFIKRHGGRDVDTKPSFEIRTLGDKPRVLHKVPLELERIARSRQLAVGTYPIKTNNSDTLTEIILRYNEDDEYPISGFPRKLHQDKQSYSRRRQVQLAYASARWGGRASQRRANQWQSPRERAKAQGEAATPVATNTAITNEHAHPWQVSRAQSQGASHDATLLEFQHRMERMRLGEAQSPTQPQQSGLRVKTTNLDNSPIVMPELYGSTYEPAELYSESLLMPCPELPALPGQGSTPVAELGSYDMSRSELPDMKSSPIELVGAGLQYYSSRAPVKSLSGLDMPFAAQVQTDWQAIGDQWISIMKGEIVDVFNEVKTGDYWYIYSRSHDLYGWAPRSHMSAAPHLSTKRWSERVESV